MRREAHLQWKRRFERDIWLLIVALVLAWPLALHAGYLDAITASRLPKEFAPHFDKLKWIEP